MITRHTEENTMSDIGMRQELLKSSGGKQRRDMSLGKYIKLNWVL